MSHIIERLDSMLGQIDSALDTAEGEIHDILTRKRDIILSIKYKVIDSIERNVELPFDPFQEI